jgi:hypothetical protein
MAESLHDQVTIHYYRPGKDTHRYVEQRIDANATRLKTISRLTPGFSRGWCEETWWKSGFIPPGMLVAAVVKYFFFQEWFSVMQLLGTDDQHLGFYVDIITPMQQAGDEYVITDIFLDLWIAPDGTVLELDREEFEQAYREGLVTSQQLVKANAMIEELKREISSGEFFRLLG